MIDCQIDPTEPGQPVTGLILLSPNRSLSWRGNVLFLLSVALLAAFIATGFALLGAWVILPFAGLEVLLVSMALYYVSRRTYEREVIHLQPEAIVVEAGRNAPQQRWQLPRDQVQLWIDPPPHPWDGPRITLAAGDEQVAVGRFLNRDDALALQQQLQALGLAVRRKPTHGGQRF